MLVKESPSGPALTNSLPPHVLHRVQRIQEAALRRHDLLGFPWLIFIATGGLGVMLSTRLSDTSPGFSVILGAGLLGGVCAVLSWWIIAQPRIRCIDRSLCFEVSFGGVEFEEVFEQLAEDDPALKATRDLITRLRNQTE